MQQDICIALTMGQLLVIKTAISSLSHNIFSKQSSMTTGVLRLEQSKQGMLVVNLVAPHKLLPPFPSLRMWWFLRVYHGRCTQKGHGFVGLDALEAFDLCKRLKRRISRSQRGLNDTVAELGRTLRSFGSPLSYPISPVKVEERRSQDSRP